jgi:hypothetical protein
MPNRIVTFSFVRKKMIEMIELSMKNLNAVQKLMSLIGGLSLKSLMIRRKEIGQVRKHKTNSEHVVL